MMAHTIKQALACCQSVVAALSGLVGCPEGGWPETEQAKRRLVDALPFRTDRNYSASDLIESALVIDRTTRRYRWR